MNIKPLNHRALIEPMDIDINEPDIFSDVQRSRYAKAKILSYSTFNENMKKEIGDVEEIDHIIVESHLIEKIKVGSSVVYTIPINAIVAKILVEEKSIEEKAKEFVSILVEQTNVMKGKKEN